MTVTGSFVDYGNHIFQIFTSNTVTPPFEIWAITGLYILIRSWKIMCGNFMLNLEKKSTFGNNIYPCIVEIVYVLLGLIRDIGNSASHGRHP